MKLFPDQVLLAKVRVVELLRGLTEDLGSDTGLQPSQSQRGSGHQDRLQAAAKDLQQAWTRSLHCQEQLLTRLEILLDWASGLLQDGGTQGEIDEWLTSH